MKFKIENILKKHKNNKIETWEAVNELLSLSIVKKNDIKICSICNEYIEINGCCPDCTIILCSPLQPITKNIKKP